MSLTYRSSFCILTSQFHLQLLSLPKLLLPIYSLSHSPPFSLSLSIAYLLIISTKFSLLLCLLQILPFCPRSIPTYPASPTSQFLHLLIVSSRRSHSAVYSHIYPHRHLHTHTHVYSTNTPCLPVFPRHFPFCFEHFPHEFLGKKEFFKSSVPKAVAAF